ncbi:hypothetical protein NDU88_005644 [Pleurodeles waltl]|uniref:Uncharacterized protein n=1 Tax=Pleurodeles waltl TaxID=8319 RepID=A0AAV7L1V9_PLEWA|nr:hypothetical protein NDU88_005644 [Pleurodeles waltl]
MHPHLTFRGKALRVPQLIWARPRSRSRLLLEVLAVVFALFRAPPHHRVRQASTWSPPMSAPSGCFPAQRPRHLHVRGASAISLGPTARPGSPRVSAASARCDSRSLTSFPCLKCPPFSTAAGSGFGSRVASVLNRARPRATLRSQHRPSPDRVYGGARYHW